MPFRIAVGRCDCRKPYRDGIEARACELIEAQLNEWRDRFPADLSSIPTHTFEHVRVEGRQLTISTYKQPLRSDATLVVYQVLVHTWSRPTFFALGAIGRMYAEGLVITDRGEIQDAPEELMWEYR